MESKGQQALRRRLEETKGEAGRLAAVAGCTPQALWNLARGQARSPRLTTALALRDHADIPLGWWEQES